MVNEKVSECLLDGIPVDDKAKVVPIHVHRSERLVEKAVLQRTLSTEEPRMPRFTLHHHVGTERGTGMVQRVPSFRRRFSCLIFQHLFILVW